MAHTAELQAKLHRSLDDIIKDKSKRPTGNEPKAIRNQVKGDTQTRGIHKKQGSQLQHRDGVKGSPGAQGKKSRAQPAANRAQHKQQPKQQPKQRQQSRQSGSFPRPDFDSMGIEQLQQLQQQRQQLEAYEQQLRQRLMQEQGMYGPDQPGFDSNDSGVMHYTAMDDAENIYIDGMAFGSDSAGQHNHHRPQPMYRQYMQDNDDDDFGFANQSNSLYAQGGQGNAYQQHHFHDGARDEYQGYYDDSYANYDDSYDNYDSQEFKVRDNYRQFDTGYERPAGDMVGDRGRGRRGHNSPQPRSRSRSRGRSSSRHRSRSPLSHHVQTRSVSPMYRHQQQHVRSLDNGHQQLKQQPSQATLRKDQSQGNRGKQQARVGTKPTRNTQQQQHHRLPAQSLGQHQAKQSVSDIKTGVVKRQAQGTTGLKPSESPRQRQMINSAAKRPAVSPEPSNAAGSTKSKRTRIEFNLPPKPSTTPTTTVSNANEQRSAASNMRASGAAGVQTHKGAAGLPDVSRGSSKEAGRPLNGSVPKSPGRARMPEQHRAHGLPKSPARHINNNSHDQDDEYDPDVEEISPRHPRADNHTAGQLDIKQEVDEPRLIAPPTVYRNATIAGGEVGFLKTVMHPSAGIEEEPVSIDDVAITIVAINHTLTIQRKKSYVLSFNQMMRVKQSMEMGMRFALINDNALLEGSGAGTVVRLPRAVIKSSEEMTDLTELGRQMLASHPEVPGQPAPPVRSAFAFIQHQLINQTDWAEIIAMYPDLYTLNAQDAAAVVFAYAELQRRKQAEQQQQTANSTATE